MLKNRITVHVKLKPHLKDFLISTRGPEPIFLPKTDKLRGLLYEMLKPRRKDQKPSKKNENTVEIIIPYFEHLNISTHNYLSPAKQKAIEELLELRFWYQFEKDMLTWYSYNINVSTSIAMFIEEYNLPYTSQMEDMLRKAFYRSQRINSKRPKRPHKRRKKFVS